MNAMEQGKAKVTKGPPHQQGVLDTAKPTRTSFFGQELQDRATNPAYPQTHQGEEKKLLE